MKIFIHTLIEYLILLNTYSLMVQPTRLIGINIFRTVPPLSLCMSHLYI